MHHIRDVQSNFIGHHVWCISEWQWGAVSFLAGIFRSELPILLTGILGAMPRCQEIIESQVDNWCWPSIRHAGCVSVFCDVALRNPLFNYRSNVPVKFERWPWWRPAIAMLCCLETSSSYRATFLSKQTWVFIFISNFPGHSFMHTRIFSGCGCLNHASKRFCPCLLMWTVQIAAMLRHDCSGLRPYSLRWWQLNVTLQYLTATTSLQGRGILWSKQWIRTNWHTLLIANAERKPLRSWLKIYVHK